MTNEKPHTPVWDHVYYLRETIRTDELKMTVKWAKTVLVSNRYKFDAIAVSGTSGLLLGSPLAMAMDKTLIVVRKDEKCHSSRMVEGDIGARRFIIVDDCIATGSTVTRMLKEIKGAAPEAVCLGVLKYDGRSSTKLTPIDEQWTPEYNTEAARALRMGEYEARTKRMEEYAKVYDAQRSNPVLYSTLGQTYTGPALYPAAYVTPDTEEAAWDYVRGKWITSAPSTAPSFGICLCKTCCAVRQSSRLLPAQCDSSYAGDMGVR